MQNCHKATSHDASMGHVMLPYDKYLISLIVAGSRLALSSVSIYLRYVIICEKIMHMLLLLMHLACFEHDDFSGTEIFSLTSSSLHLCFYFYPAII